MESEITTLLEHYEKGRVTRRQLVSGLGAMVAALSGVGAILGAQETKEKEAKEKRDIILDEAAHILADEIGLIRADTKLAAQVLPRGVNVPTEVN